MLTKARDSRRQTRQPWESANNCLLTEGEPDATSEFIGQSVRSTFLTPRDQKDTTHTSNFGVKVQEHCKVNQVTCDLFNTEEEGIKYTTTQDYLRATFKGQRP